MIRVDGKSAEEKVTHVLLADDDEEDYFFFSIAISEIPIKVLLTRAEDGEKLMQLLDKKIPDILFLDLLMPCMKGHDCLHSIRSDRRFDKLPIIVYTSMDDIANIEFCFREGSNLYAIKPSNIDDLKSMLDRILTIDWKKLLYFPVFSKFVIRTQ